MKFLTILLVIMTISIPASFNVLKTFSADASVALGDYMDTTPSGDEDEDGNDSPPLTEIEEVETQILAVIPKFSLFLNSGKYRISHNIPTFIPSYIFSIFIPPSH